MSADSRIRSALREFGVEPARIRRAYHSNNQKYRVTSTTGAVHGLRIGRRWWPSHAWARSTSTWLSLLHESGLAVPPPLRTVDGDWIASYRDPDGAEIACTLESWLPGRRHLATRTAADASALGELLAGLHRRARCEDQSVCQAQPSTSTRTHA